MQDPLNISVSLNNVETSLPLLPEGDYSVQVKESNVGPNKDKNGLNWFIKFGTTGAATALDGRMVNPDFPLFMTIALQAREDSKDPEAYKRSIAEAVDVIFGTDKNNRPDLTTALVAEAVGKVLTATVIIDEYQGVKNNKVRRLKKNAA